MLRLLLVPALLLLTACQTSNVQRDYDPNRDFGMYRTWSWATPPVQYKPDDPRIKSDLTEQRVTEAVAAQLEQRGLRPAPSGATGDVTVQAWLIIDERQQQVTSGYQPMWGGYRYNYWPSPAFTETRTISYSVGTLQVDIFDGRDGKLIWRGSTEQVTRPDPKSPQERAQAIRETVNRVLSQYPPR
jgi:hypothetical protein